jgi:hypothetical protein
MASKRPKLFKPTLKDEKRIGWIIGNEISPNKCVTTSSSEAIRGTKIPKKCYTDYLEKANNYKPARIDFDTYQEARTWMHENIHNGNSDIINYY